MSLSVVRTVVVMTTTATARATMATDSHVTHRLPRTVPACITTRLWRLPRTETGVGRTAAVSLGSQ